eukprot:gene41502-51405_t
MPALLTHTRRSTRSALLVPSQSAKVKDIATCAAGSVSVNGVCTFCPVGTYALAAAQSCTHCPSGYSAPINSVSPDACYPLASKKVKDLVTCAAVGAKKVKATCDAGSAPVDGVCTF